MPHTRSALVSRHVAIRIDHRRYGHESSFKRPLCQGRTVHSAIACTSLFRRCKGVLNCLLGPGRLEDHAKRPAQPSYQDFGYHAAENWPILSIVCQTDTCLTRPKRLLYKTSVCLSRRLKQSCFIEGLTGPGIAGQDRWHQSAAEADCGPIQNQFRGACERFR